MLKHVFSKKNRALLAELVRTDFKLRYQGSVLGYTWSLLRPLLMFLILYLVFGKFLRFGGEISHYPIYLLLGIVMWFFFADMTNQSTASIVARGDLIRKIRISRWIIVLSSSVSALINLGLNLIVVGIFTVVSGVDLHLSGLWLFVLLVEVYILGLGMSLFLAAAYVRYRDVSYIWDVVMQAGFYLTPIIYPITVITNVTLQKIMLLNPMAQAIQDARKVLVTLDTTTVANVYNSTFIRLIPMTFCLLVLAGGVLYFKRQAKTFAENL